MSLYGALYSGVSGLKAQSNKIGIISDNISNTNTVGYKGNRGGFESLVTSSASDSQFSPGGVLGANQQLVNKQGLLQSTDSATDIAVSGDGFFVVNQQSNSLGQVNYTRAGSFTQDSTGNFRNAAGFFLQAWPLDREGRLPGATGNLNTNSSANLTSLTTVNVTNLTGVAASTSTVSIGANLNSGQTAFPGASGTAKPDPFHAENAGVSSKAILVPGGVNNLTRGDRITVATGQGLSYTYRYSGYTFGRDVTSPSSVGDNGQVVTSSPDTITAAAAAITSVSTPTPTILPSVTLTTAAAAITNISTTGVAQNFVTVTTTATHGLATGDTVDMAGVVGTAGAIDGVPVAEINGKHVVTVTGANTYTIATTTITGGTSVTDATGGMTEQPLPFTSTSSSPVVKVRSVAHGLTTGDIVVTSGNTDAISGIPAGDLNGQFSITVLDADHYSITVATTAGATISGGGNATSVSAIPRLSSATIANTITVNTVGAHGLTTGDSVTLAGVVGAGTPAVVDGVPITEINGAHTITVTGANTYTIATTTATLGFGVTDTSGGGATIVVSPFEATNTSDVVKVRQAGHGLVNNEVVTLSGNLGDVGGIPAGDLNGTFLVTVIDDDHYTIKVASTATSTAAGGTGSVVATTRLFSGAILDASNATTRFLANAGTSSFSTSALSFSITTTATGTVNFTYTSAAPNAQLGQFNTLTNLADAISAISGLTARVSGGQLYVGAVDANAALSFANGSSVGTAGPPVQWGIDWVRELGFANLSTGSDRFSSLDGLAKLVNNSSGVTANVASALSSATVKINVDNPLDTITFSDFPAIANVTLGVTPFATTAGSGVVTVTLPTAPSPAYVTGDVVDLGTLAGGPYDGIAAADLSGAFSVTVVNATTFTIVAKNSALATTGIATGPTGISLTQPQNYGSLVAELGLVASLNGASYTAQTTGSVGPAYSPSDATKNIAGGAITAQFSRPIRVYDSLGTGHDLSMSFIKTDINTWAVEVYAATSSEVTTSLPNGQVVTGKITFNGDGTLQSIDSALANPVNITWNNGSVASVITFDWGTSGSPFGTANASSIGKTDGLSQFNSDYRVNFVEQNGAPVGDLTSVSITHEGFVVASYSNGQTQNLFKIPLADFANPNQLATSSGNVFLQSSESGEVNLRESGSSGVGKIAASSLEQSNVELAEQLTDMIVAQRAYQANTKVISTTDQLLSQLNDILR